MSWSVSATGTPAEVLESLKKQFEAPLADPPRGISWEGERHTVARVADNIYQTLNTFDPEQQVQVSAYGHGSEGHYQQVNLSINPWSGAPAAQAGPADIQAGAGAGTDPANQADDPATGGTGADPQDPQGQAEQE